MSEKARQYKPSTVRRLDTLSGNQCCEPNCKKPLVAEDGISIVSKICHIEAASANGPRYNPNMTDDDRRHYDNLILLCDEHHAIIDNKENESKFPKSLLVSWKREHEGKMIYKLRKSSVLKEAVYSIADIELGGEIASGEDMSSFDISNKISYNNLRRNRYTVNEYKVFYPKINSIYDELESAGSFRKEKLLRNIKSIYLKAKGKYIEPDDDELQKLRDHADDIFEEVEDILYNSLVNDNDSILVEDLAFGISVIMVDAFMRCKILERPPI